MSFCMPRVMSEAHLVELDLDHQTFCCGPLVEEIRGTLGRSAC